MAQTGYTPISIYYSSTATNTPTAGNLVAGELAINTADGKLFYKDSAGVVQVIGTKGGVGSSSTTQVLYNSSGLVVGSANLVTSTSSALSLTSQNGSGSTGTLRILDYSTNNSSGYIQFVNNSGSSQYAALGGISSGGLLFDNQAGEVMRIDSSGNVGIGTNSPQYKLHVNTGTDGYVGATGGSLDYRTLLYTTGSVVYTGTWSSTPLAFNTGGTERMRIDSSGNVLVGTTSGSSKFNLTTVSGGSAITITDGTASGLAWQMGPRVGTGTLTDFGFYNATGSVFLGRMTSAGVWYQGNNSATWSITSDERIKENINTLNNGLSIITALRPVEFDYKISKKHDIGFIAQEYQKILPEQINENEPTNETKEFIDDGKLLSISSNLVPYLVKAIQELNAKVIALEAQLGAK